MTLTVQISQISMSMDINNIIDVFTTTLVKKAQLLIPSIKITNRKLVHWQTKKKKCTNAIRRRQKLLRNLKTMPSFRNHLEFKEVRVKAK